MTKGNALTCNLLKGEEFHIHQCPVPEHIRPLKNILNDWMEFKYDEAQTPRNENIRLGTKYPKERCPSHEKGKQKSSGIYFQSCIYASLDKA